MASGSSRTPPLLLFRGDSRKPDLIFKDGFVAKGGLDGVVDLLSHVKGGEKLKATGLISTSQSLRIPPIFMDFLPKDGRLDTKTGPDGQIYTNRFGWIYQIKPSSDLKMEYIPDFLGKNHPDLKPLYNYQQEWAVYYSIPPKNIKSAQRFQGYVRNQDLLDGRGPFTVSIPGEQPFHEVVENPRYKP